MAAHIISRLIQMVFVIIILTIVCFLLIQIIPGDPVLTLLGSNSTQEEIDAVRHELGLDRPVLIQYFHWAANVLRGDLGESIQYQESVSRLMAKRLPVTLYLGILAFVTSSIVGTALGIICAVRRGSVLDQTITVIANLGIAAPQFWIGIMFIYLFGLRLGWLPIQGFTSPFENFSLSFRQIIMPVFCLGFMPVASLARYARSAMLEVIQEDYIRTAWSKGLSEKVIIARHALKNALIPVVTMLGMRSRVVFGGSVLIETVFNIPGVGRLLVDSVFDKDFVIVQAGVIMMALIVALTNLAVDVSYGYINPRVRYR